ncbi:DUF927 domain-containing protein [Paracoccus liaowanqingii]|uniref:DUF927 domain-containing protein n=1 Tax=Paracoccus liaowanqingii TaxID=2560053 RepID=UPI00143CD067|nr:DUF927 domain-containing protein [Paracoccus liaowanqingii]
MTAKLVPLLDSEEEIASHFYRVFDRQSSEPEAEASEAAGRNLVIAQTLAADPEPPNLERFAALVREAVPPGFTVPRHTKVIVDEEFKPVCDLIRVEQWARRPDMSGYALKVTFAARDGGMKTLILEDSDLTSRNGISRLVDHGFCLLGSKTDLIRLLRSWENVPVAWRVDKTGWMETPGGRIFIRADGQTILRQTHSVEPVIMFNPERVDMISGGTFAGWKEQVARLALGNDLLIFAICAAIMPALLKSAAIETAVFNLFANGPVGKSLILAVATSADRSPATGARWSDASQSLQRLHALTRDGMLALDALPENPPGKLLAHLTSLGDDGIYTQNENDWRGVTMSTSERPLTGLLHRFRRTVPAAMIARNIDIRADIGRYGCLNDLHGHPDYEEFAAAMHLGFKTHYGHLAPAFTQIIVNWREDIEAALPAWIRDAIAEIKHRAGISEPVTDVARKEALRRLALAAVAGEKAIGFGLLPWPKGTAMSAICTVASLWNVTDAQGGGPANVVCQLRAFLNDNGTGFVWTNTVHPSANHDMASGWQDDDYYYLTAGHVDAMPGLREAMIELAARNILAPGGQTNSWQYKMGRNIPGRPNVYRIRKNWLRAEFEA